MTNHISQQQKVWSKDSYDEGIYSSQPLETFGKSPWANSTTIHSYAETVAQSDQSNQPTNQPTDRTNQQTNQPSNKRLTNQTKQNQTQQKKKKTTNQPTKHRANRLIDRSTNQPINQSTNCKNGFKNAHWSTKDGFPHWLYHQQPNPHPGNTIKRLANRF